MLKITLAAAALSTISANFLEFDRHLQVSGTQSTVCITDATCNIRINTLTSSNLARVNGTTVAPVNGVCALKSIQRNCYLSYRI